MAATELAFHIARLQIAFYDALRDQELRMSITGLQPGAIQAKLMALQQKVQDSRARSMAKLDAAAVKHGMVDAEIDKLVVKMEKEADDALHEFAQFTNGAPEDEPKVTPLPIVSLNEAGVIPEPK